MTKFAEFQKKAKRLATRFAENYVQHLGCFRLFSMLIPNNDAMRDATTISRLAQSLDETYELIQYVKSVTKNPKLTLDEFNEFRRKVLIGIYLVKWFQYNSLVDSYLRKSLIDLFRSDLELRSLEEMNPDFFNSCLKEFSYYCTFVFEKSDEKTYTSLNNRLGATIQKEIHDARNFNKNSSRPGFYRGISVLWE